MNLNLSHIAGVYIIYELAVGIYHRRATVAADNPVTVRSMDVSTVRLSRVAKVSKYQMSVNITWVSTSG